MSELWRHDATTLAGLIARKEVSSSDVVESHLARIDAVNGKLNAVTEVLADSARAASAAADAAIVAGRSMGPLHGVPCTVKQNIDLVGCSTNWGLPALLGALPPADSPVVERMKGAGAIPIGRTNCPDMALRVHTESSAFGLTRTPWRHDRTAGGSSGGEGSALASGMSPIGLGNDIGGSLRNPATCNGVASLKPSAGRVPLFTAIPAPEGPASFQMMPVEGPMARTVRDVRLGLRILEGRDPRDPYSSPVPAPRPPRSRPIRVAVLANPPGGTTNADVAAVVQRAGDALVAAGYEAVDEAPPRFEETIEMWKQFIVADIRMLAPMMSPMMSSDANQFLQYTLDEYEPVDLAGYTAILMTRQSLMRDWAVWMQGVDLVLTPTWTQIPFAHGWDALSRENALATIEQMRCVTIANVLGLPAACVPAGTVDGSPVAAMLTADRWSDDVALDAAEIIEADLALPTPIDPTW